MAISKKDGKGKGGPITIQKRNIIMDELTKLVQNGKIRNLDYSEFARQHKTTRQALYRITKEIYSQIPPEEIQRVMIDFKFTFERLETEVNACLIEAETVKEKLDVIRTYFLLMKEKTEYMERFFIKEKARENINLEANITQRSLNIHIITSPEQLQNESSN